MISPKLAKLLVPAYVLFLIISFFYVRSVLERVPASEYEQDEKVVAIPKEIKAFLDVSGPGVSKTYKLTVKDNDSVADLVLKTKETYDDFIYDRTAYSYGYRFDHVNNVKSTGEHEWRIFDGDTDITEEMDSKMLTENKVYLLQYTEIN